MQARFLQIKSALVADIEAGELSPGDKVASENKLASHYGVSRMTARRALTELTDEGILFRTQGLGTFVADHRPMSSMLTIRSIVDEIHQRGHSYHNQVVTQQALNANDEQAAKLGLAAGDSVFYTRIVHFEDGIPVQLEDRLVNPVIIPDYLQQDFHQVSTYSYLNQVAPLTQADHVIEANLPEPGIATLLQIPLTQPCLQVSRRTWSRSGIVSVAELIHPGNRYRLGGHLDFHNI